MKIYRGNCLEKLSEEYLDDLLGCLDNMLYLTCISLFKLAESYFDGCFGFAKRLKLLLEIYFLYKLLAIFSNNYIISILLLVYFHQF